MPLKEPESWTQLQSICLALIIVSGFAGALCALAAMYFEWPQELAGFACGISGYAGSRILAIFERKFISSISNQP